MLKPLAAVDLHKEIMKMSKKFGISYIDALMHYCEKNDIDPEVIGKIVKKSSAFKAQVEEEAEALNLVEKVKNRLPL